MAGPKRKWKGEKIDLAQDVKHISWGPLLFSSSSSSSSFSSSSSSSRHTQGGQINFTTGLFAKKRVFLFSSLSFFWRREKSTFLPFLRGGEEKDFFGQNVMMRKKIKKFILAQKWNGRRSTRVFEKERGRGRRGFAMVVTEIFALMLNKKQGTINITAGWLCPGAGGTEGRGAHFYLARRRPARVLISHPHPPSICSRASHDLPITD